MMPCERASKLRMTIWNRKHWKLQAEALVHPIILLYKQIRLFFWDLISVFSMLLFVIEVMSQWNETHNSIKFEATASNKKIYENLSQIIIHINFIWSRKRPFIFVILKYNDHFFITAKYENKDKQAFFYVEFVPSAFPWFPTLYPF